MIGASARRLLLGVLLVAHVAAAGCLAAAAAGHFVLTSLPMALTCDAPTKFPPKSSKSSPIPLFLSFSLPHSNRPVDLLTKTISPLLTESNLFPCRDAANSLKSFSSNYNLFRDAWEVYAERKRLAFHEGFTYPSFYENSLQTDPCRPDRILFRLGGPKGEKSGKTDGKSGKIDGKSGISGLGGLSSPPSPPSPPPLHLNQFLVLETSWRNQSGQIFSLSDHKVILAEFLIPPRQ